MFAAQSKYLRCVSGITSQQLFIWSNYWNNVKVISQLSGKMLFYNKVKESPSCLRSEPGPGSVWCAGMYTALGHCALTHTNSHYNGNSHCSKGVCLNVELSVGFMVNLLCPLLLNQQEYSRGMSTKKLPVVISRRSLSLFIQCVNAAIRVCVPERCSSGTGTSRFHQPPFTVSSV